MRTIISEFITPYTGWFQSTMRCGFVNVESVSKCNEMSVNIKRMVSKHNEISVY